MARTAKKTPKRGAKRMKDLPAKAGKGKSVRGGQPKIQTITDGTSNTMMIGDGSVRFHSLKRASKP